jgi:hypothetical protein
MLPLSKQYGNAGRIARWIFENIEDPLDYWEYGSVTGARSDIRLAIGDTVVTLENKWWGVRGSRTHLSSYVPTNPLQILWGLRYGWAPVWLRESFSFSWGTKVLHNRLKGVDSFSWPERWRNP